MIIIFTIKIKVYSRHLTVLEHQCQKSLSCGQESLAKLFLSNYSSVYEFSAERRMVIRLLPPCYIVVGTMAKFETLVCFYCEIKGLK